MKDVRMKFEVFYLPRIRTILSCFMLLNLQLTVDFFGLFCMESTPACWMDLHIFLSLLLVQLHNQQPWNKN